MCVSGVNVYQCECVDNCVWMGVWMIVSMDVDVFGYACMVACL